MLTMMYLRRRRRHHFESYFSVVQGQRQDSFVQLEIARTNMVL